MWFKKLLVLLAAMFISWGAYVVFIRHPVTSRPRLGSRVEYPLRLKLAGVLLLAASAVLLGLVLRGSVPEDAAWPGFVVSAMLGLSGAWASVESIGTRFEVHPDFIEKTILFHRTRIRWADVNRIAVTRNKDGVLLEADGSRMRISMRLVNLYAFAFVAMDKLPRPVLEASPAAARLIGQPLRSGPGSPDRE